MSRTLKRGAWIDEFTDTDLPWLWAAYRKGQWDVVPADLSKEDFLAAIGEILVNFESVISLQAVTMIDGKRRAAPVGFMAEQVINDGHGMRIEPHVEFFPWASPRNKLEVVLKYLNVRRHQVMIVIWSTLKDADFFKHMMRYGILRRVGTLHDPAGNRAVFQTREPGFV